MSETNASGRFRCIVAAIDFSPESEHAVTWAAELAARRGAELCLVHAVAWSEPTDILAAFNAEVTGELAEAARRRLAEVAAPLRSKVRSIVTEVGIGPPARVIREQAEAHGAELVVVGTRGLRGWQHLMLGSTAERTIGTAACPVLAVHRGEAPPPERSWRLLAATDGSAEAGTAVRAAARLLVPDPGEVVLLRAFEPPPVAFAGGAELATYSLAGVARGAAADELEREARGLVAEGIDARPVLRDGFAPEVIVRAAVELGADVIVMGTRGRGTLTHLLLGSTAERVAQRATVPVLVVPRRAEAALERATGALAIVGAPADAEC